MGRRDEVQLQGARSLLMNEVMITEQLFKPFISLCSKHRLINGLNTLSF